MVGLLPVAWTEHANEDEFFLGHFVSVSAPICPSIVTDVSLTDQVLRSHFSFPILIVSLSTASFLRLRERGWVQLHTGALCAHLHRI